MPRMVGVLAVLACVAGGIPLAAAPPVPANVERSDPVTRCVVATYRLTGPAPRAAEDVTCYFFLPQDEPRQEVHDLRFQPEPAEVFTDEHGRRVARFFLPYIRPGEYRAVRWMARVTTYRTRHRLRAPPGQRCAELDADARRLYLADKPPYRLRSPFIAEVARGLGADTLSDRETVQAACDYLNQTVRYEMVGGWDDAEIVLRRGTGSCSEFAYAFIALCRARGVPARYIGGTTFRKDVPCSFDDANHRWMEAFLDGVGWVPVDFRVRGYKGDGFYMMPAERLSLGHGDGDGKAPLGWAYTCGLKARVPPHAVREYVWCQDPSARTFARVHRIASGMRGSGPRDLGRAVADLLAISQPVSVPFLADVLHVGDPAAAAAAAEALCRIDEPAARRYRFLMRSRREVWSALTRGLERIEPDARRGRPGEWTDLFDGRRLGVPLAEEGPFRVERVDGETWLTNSDRLGQTLFDYRTGDRCLIDLVFTHRGVGRAGLVFAHAGRRCRLRLPFHVSEEPHLRFNRLEGVRGCPRGTYGVEPERLHRALLLVDGYMVLFVLDGRRVFYVGGEGVGPGRVGLSVWGKETRMQVRRLRVFEGGETASLLGAMTEVLAKPL